MSKNQIDLASFLDIQEVLGHEINLIKQSWIRSYRKMGMAKYLDQDFYFATMTNQVNQILGDPRCRVLTAKAKVDRKIVLGYMVLTEHSRETSLDYLFVKANYRKNGIGSYLLGVGFSSEQKPLVCTFFPGNPSKLKNRDSLVFLGRKVHYKPRGIV